MLRRGGDSSAVKYELLYPGTGGVVVRGLRAEGSCGSHGHDGNGGVVREGLVDSANRGYIRRGTKRDVCVSGSVSGVRTRSVRMSAVFTRRAHH